MHLLSPRTGALVLSLLLATAALAQDETQLRAGGVSYRTFFSEGELTMQVFIISSTGNTGIYEVGKDTRLLELITLAGFAPPVRTAQASVRNTLSVIRPRLSSEEPIYQARLEQFVLEPERHPALEDGDVILIESVQKAKFTWREAISVVSSISTVLLLADRLGLVRFRRY